MAEWLRPRAYIAENGLNIRRISVGSILSLKEVHRLGVWCLHHVPSLLWLAPKPIFKEGRMAEWLRPRTSIAENGLNIRRISVGSILSLKKVHRLGGWC